MRRFLKQVMVLGLIAGIGCPMSALSETFFNETGSAIAKQGAAGHGSGTPTQDLANITAGVLNVEAVFGVFHENEVVRDMDTRACAIMGVSDIGGGESTGKHCCKKLWEAMGTFPLMTYESGRRKVTRHMGGKLGGRNKDKDNRLKKYEQFMDYCCEMSDDKTKGDDQIFCQTRSSEKKGCVKDEMNNGSTMEAALSACDINCEMKNYGTFKHNEDGKYDEKELDAILRVCTDDDATWSPSTTVPGSAEFVPTVPDNMKKILTQGGGSK